MPEVSRYERLGEEDDASTSETVGVQTNRVDLPATDDTDDLSTTCTPPATESFWADFRNRQRAAPKVYYFLFSAGMAGVIPFLPVYFRMNGLTASQNGLLGGLRPFVNFWSGPLLSAVADKYRRRRLVLCLGTIALIGLTLPLKFVPSSAPDGCGASEGCQRREAGGHTTWNGSQPTTKPGEATKTLRMTSLTQPLAADDVSTAYTADTNNQSILANIDSLTYTPTHTDAMDIELTSSIADNTTDASAPDNKKTFYPIAALIFLSELFSACVFGLGDTLVIESLGESHSIAYGYQRLWGAIGWGVANAAVGYGASALADHCGNGNYNVHFISFVLITSLSLVPQSLLNSKKTTTAIVSREAVNIKKGLRLVFAQVRVIAFFVAIFFLSMAMSIVDNFLFWFLSELCASELLLGLSLFVMAASEIPLFTLAGRMITRFGHAFVLCFVFACYVLRFVAYSVLSDPWWVLPIELLHGVTFALMWSCSVSYAKKIAPPNLEATMQGLLNGVYWGFGRGIGSIVGGQLYSHYGARWTFRVSAVVCATCGCAYALAELCTRREEKSRRSSKVDESDEWSQGLETVALTGTRAGPSAGSETTELTDIEQQIDMEEDAV